MQAVLTAMQSKYGGLMAAQSATFDGMLSNLRDWAGATLRETGKPLFDVLRTQLANLMIVAQLAYGGDCAIVRHYILLASMANAWADSWTGC